MSYVRNRYIVRYWSRYRVNWVSVLVDAPSEESIAEILGPQGVTEFEVVRNLGSVI